MVFIRSVRTTQQAEDENMNVSQDLVGKTITGVIASPSAAGTAREIWMLQFSDGTHVEFVSPGARRALRGSLKQPLRGRGSQPLISAQLALNVA